MKLCMIGLSHNLEGVVHLLVKNLFLIFTFTPWVSQSLLMNLHKNKF